MAVAAGPRGGTSPPPATQARGQQAGPAGPAAMAHRPVLPGHGRRPPARRALRRRPGALEAGGGKDANNEMARSNPAMAARGTRMVARPQSAAPPLRPRRGRHRHHAGRGVRGRRPAAGTGRRRAGRHGGPRAGQAQRAGWHRVPAVLRTATVQRFAPSPALAWARWTGLGGVRHTGRVPAPAGLAAGAVVPVWVDAAGRLAGPAAPPGQQGSRAPADGLVAVLLLAELLCGGGWPPVASWTGAAWRRGTPNGGPSARPGAATHDLHTGRRPLPAPSRALPHPVPVPGPAQAPPGS